MIPHSHQVIRNASGPFDGGVMLDYEGRLLRRKRLACDAGDFLVDLPEVTSLEDGDAFLLSDGRRILVHAAAEPVLVIRGDLPRLAWHIGNRHTPCRIEAERLIIRADHVLEAMLDQLGARIEHASLPFSPEKGAYGHGRTFGHDHGHFHAHAHDHDHQHDHA
ncbi:urease accessory protein UreE [Paracoccus saliphilus]|uniref:Urease accessory protein UreE n=1 Tax=Paracoccus saliphilus TaxID=405559 RepID=A0AA45W5X2_9RHOB|nr:urease accessory protein UreE [Paracoccus saliphilus]WCR05642.1 urease accessory protein UreE [Paracoccus saliphilus]SIS96701.1 urease accessory protein [Paracoccus saliphilus]